MNNLRQNRLKFAAIVVSAFLTVLISVVYLGHVYPEGSRHRVSYMLMCGVFDGLIAILPLVLFKGKWRWIELMPVVVIPVIVIVNALFFRNYLDLIPGNMYFMSQITDPMVVAGAKASLRWQDLTLLIMPVVSVVLMAVWRREMESQRISLRLKWGYGVMLFLSFAAVFMGALRSRWINVPRFTKWENLKYMVGYNHNNWRDFFEGGIHGYLLRCAVDPLNFPKDMSDEERNRITLYFEKRNKEEWQADSIRRINREASKDKNLVIVVVESLSSKIFDYPDRAAYMPYMDKLMADSAVMTVPHVLPQVSIGQSSDGQFIYNTGLLPLQGEALILNYSSKDYPSLAKALGIESAEVIGESSAMWRHMFTSESYGFNRLIGDTGGDDPLHVDENIFKRALAEVDNFKGRFFLFVTTLTMHDPYDEPLVADPVGESIKPGFPVEDRNYLERVRYFDRWLGWFVEGLKERGLLENTVVVIASDHQIRPDNVSDRVLGDYIPWIIINGPKGGIVEEAVRQCDLFPTVLDIFGVDYSYKGVPYRGLGKSLLTADSVSSPRDLSMDEEWDISRLIVTRINDRSFVCSGQ